MRINNRRICFIEELPWCGKIYLEKMTFINLLSKCFWFSEKE
jgi:hypothetical protein